jgi:hypothetical protein
MAQARTYRKGVRAFRDFMKTLRKGKKYIKVSPLPNQWFTMREVSKAAESKGKFQESFKKLRNLLSDGWAYCPKSELRDNIEYETSVDESKKSRKKKAGKA